VVIPIITVRDGNHYKIILDEPLNLDDDTKLSPEQTNALIGKYITEYLQQYMWSLKRFGTQPNLKYGKLYDVGEQ
jgi:lauroyl/myristoyl acyltransferase